MKAEGFTSFLISPDNTVVEAMQRIDSNARGILFAADENCKLMGVLTDGDIRRWLIRTGELHAAVEQVMNHSPKVINPKEIAASKEYMEKLVITALPVVDEAGVSVDIIFRESKDGIF